MSTEPTKAAAKPNKLKALVNRMEEKKKAELPAPATVPQDETKVPQPQSSTDSALSDKEALAQVFDGPNSKAEADAPIEDDRESLASVAVEGDGVYFPSYDTLSASFKKHILIICQNGLYAHLWSGQVVGVGYLDPNDESVVTIDEDSGRPMVILKKDTQMDFLNRVLILKYSLSSTYPGVGLMISPYRMIVFDEGAHMLSTTDDADCQIIKAKLQILEAGIAVESGGLKLFNTSSAVFKVFYRGNGGPRNRKRVDNADEEATQPPQKPKVITARDIQDDRGQSRNDGDGRRKDDRGYNRGRGGRRGGRGRRGNNWRY